MIIKDDKDKQILELFYQGHTTTKGLMDKTGFSKGVIDRVLRENGIIRRPNPEFGITKEKMNKWYFEDKLSFRQIAELVGDGCTKEQIRVRFRSFGLKPRPALIKLRSGYELTEDDIQEFYFNQGMTQRQIAKIIDRSQNYVKNRMLKLGIAARDQKEAQLDAIATPFNEKFFDEWNSTMAYVLGFFYADGNLYDDKFRIVLAERDRELIEDIMDAMDIPRDYLKKFYSKHFDKYSYGFTISRIYTANRLRELGITPNKSRSTVFPDVPKQYLPDFIRGYFDGDGSVVPKNSYVAVLITCGSEIFIKKLQDILIENLDGQGVIGITLDKRGNINYSLRITSRSRAESFYRFIYHRPGLIALKRKKERFDKIFS